MDRATNIHLANVVRLQEKKLATDNHKYHEEFLAKKFARVESKAGAFLIDQKYSLQLDELI